MLYLNVCVSVLSPCCNILWSCVFCCI